MATTKKTIPAETNEAAVVKETATVAEVKTEAVKEAAEAPKSAAKKSAAKKPAAKKPAAKKETEKKPAAKKTPKKKGITYDDVVAAAKKKVAGADITKIKYPIAANVELNGAVDGIFYIYIDGENISVEPYKYDDYDVYLRADVDEFMNVIGGKKNIYDAFAEGLIKIDGNTKKAILLVNAAF